MDIVDLADSYDKTLNTAAEVIWRGGLVVFPSDSVYGLAVDPTDQEAVNKLLSFKERWPGKAVSIAVADKKMAEEFVVLGDNARNIYDNLLPGPFTIVSEGKHKVAKGIEAENGTLGIRIPDYKLILDLVIKLKGPMTATSANLSGRTPHYSVQSFLKTLSDKKKSMIDLVIDGGKLPKNLPSTVIDLTEPDIKILRRGDLIVGKKKTLVSKSEKETGKIAEFIYNKAQASSVFTTKPLVFGLSGDLGCGKTVFSRAIGKLLGVDEKITSPTFVIWNEYTILPNPSFTSEGHNIRKFLHFDLYRLGNKFEFEEIKFLEQFTPGTIACIEWPELMGEENLSKLKEIANYVPVNFEYEDENTRSITVAENQ